MLAERGANKSDGWGLGSSAAEWLILPAGGELMRPKARTRSVLRRAVSSARLRRCHLCDACPATNRRDQNPRRGECSAEQCRPHILRRCRPCGACPATNRRGPCHLTAVVIADVGGKALPPLRSHPRRNRGCGLDGKQKRNRYKNKSERLEERCHKSISSSSTPHAKLLGGTQSAPCRFANGAGPRRVLTFFSFIRDVALFDSTRAPDSF